jgi:ATP-dependent Clp protease ATP-binding subunit ClpC
LKFLKSSRFRTSIGRNSRTKNVVVKKQKYEEAAKLRDDEKRIEKKLPSQEQWEEDAKNNRIEVTEDNVADVVSMMTGIPVNRIAQTESNKLAILRN